MRCYWCDRPIEIARKVKLRPWREFDLGNGVANSVAHHSYCENMTYRLAFICNAWYRMLDNEVGLAEIPGNGLFNLAEASRFDKATAVNEAEHRAFQMKEARKMDFEPGEQ